MTKTQKTETGKPDKKPRKEAAGPLREKARSKRKLLNAVGKVLQKYSYPGLTTVNIAKEAGLNRKLIYDYFGTLDNLIETYILKKDFWGSTGRPVIEKLAKKSGTIGDVEMTALLQAQFDALLKDKVQQKILHWGLGEKNQMLKKVSEHREEMGEKILPILDQEFANSEIDIRAFLAIQIAGIYYLSMHAKSYGTTFCGVDINQQEGKSRIFKMIEYGIKTAFTNASKV